MTRTKPLRLSQHLAWVTVFGVVLLMMAPFGGRAGAGSMRMRSASMLPLLAAHSLTDAASFHCQAYRNPLTASESPQYRDPGVEKARLEARREILVAKRVTPLEVDFQAPRLGWSRLEAEDRRALDQIAERTKVTALELHGNGSPVGSLERLRWTQKRLHLGRNGTAPLLVVGNGSLTGDGEIEVRLGEAQSAVPGPLAIQFVGDFHSRGPTRAQLAALDEIVDYLAIRVGHLPIHSHEDPAEARSQRGSQGCLGPLFPLDLIRLACGVNDP